MMSFIAIFGSGLVVQPKRSANANSCGLNSSMIWDFSDCFTLLARVKMESSGSDAGFLKGGYIGKKIAFRSVRIFLVTLLHCLTVLLKFLHTTCAYVIHHARFLLGSTFFCHWLSVFIIIKGYSPLPGSALESWRSSFATKIGLHLCLSLMEVNSTCG